MIGLGSDKKGISQTLSLITITIINNSKHSPHHCPAWLSLRILSSAILGAAVQLLSNRGHWPNANYLLISLLSHFLSGPYLITGLPCLLRNQLISSWCDDLNYVTLCLWIYSSVRASWSFCLCCQQLVQIALSPHYLNIAKGTTDPRVEFISRDHSPQFSNIEHGNWPTCNHVRKLLIGPDHEFSSAKSY